MEVPRADQAFRHQDFVERRVLPHGEGVPLREGNRVIGVEGNVLQTTLRAALGMKFGREDEVRTK
jgi:hypothetical protein